MIAFSSTGYVVIHMACNKLLTAKMMLNFHRSSGADFVQEQEFSYKEQLLLS